MGSVPREERNLNAPVSFRIQKTTGPSRWVTRERPKVERIACPWLIRRFLDPNASFFFVSPELVIAEATRLDAIPFDVPGIELSHNWERCTFDAMLDAFDLHEPALDALAHIVRAADTARLKAAAPAAGLLAISVGLSRMYPVDQDMLDAGMLVYDALLEWCRDGQGESHGWLAHEVPDATGSRHASR
jgi:hypothetical protein